MATHYATSRPRFEHRFFVDDATIMALVIVAGFSMQLAMGRSTFRAPAMVHVHALTFFGWTGFYLLRNYALSDRAFYGSVIAACATSYGLSRFKD